MAINFNSLSSVLRVVSRALRIPSPRARTIPSPLILASRNKPGMSAKRVSSNIISRMVEAGINVGPLPSGAANPNEILVTLIVEEIIKEIHQNMRITVAIPPGVTLIANGGNAGGPITVVGKTTVIASGNGVPQ